jgi:hypothetical protein
MKEATKLLLSLRENSKFVEVQPKKYRGAKLNKCFQNAAFFSADKKEYSIVSGWLVGDHFESTGTVFVPHYWLEHTPSNVYYDTSPTALNDTQFYDYILDMDIYKHLTQTSYVPPPVVVRENGSLQARLNDGRFIGIEKIDVLELYQLVRN